MADVIAIITGFLTLFGTDLVIANHNIDEDSEEQSDAIVFGASSRNVEQYECHFT